MKRQETRQHVTVRLAPDLVRQVEESKPNWNAEQVSALHAAVIEKFLSSGLNGK